MVGKSDDGAPNSLPIGERIYPDARYKFGIPVDWFVDYYNVRGRETQTVLRKYPTLVYLLGSVTTEPQGQDDRPDNVRRSIYYLTEGSAMFGLKNKDDAMRWRGIFNHVMGTARQVFYLAKVLNGLSEKQREQFTSLGLDFTEFDEIHPEVLRDFLFISHARRRETDERAWHQLDDEAHQELDPGKATVKYLTKLNAPQIFIELMRVESHADHLAKVGQQTMFPNMVDNVLTYTDWTFAQKPNTLKERFNGLRSSKRIVPEILDVLEKCGKSFENALEQIVSPNIWQEMTSAGPYDWDIQIRKAYCAPSGLQLEHVFPDYVRQFQIK